MLDDWNEQESCEARPLLDRSKTSSMYAQIAQSVEQRIENPRVGGSIPPLGTTPNHKPL